MTDDLVSWLRERLDEDERLATATGYVDAADPWEAPSFTACYPEGAVWADEDDRRYIEHFSPHRALAEVQAKRAILDRYEKAAALERGPQAQPVSINTPTARLEKALAEVTAPELRRVVRLLAAVFSDRPGYQEDWRP